LDKIEAARRQNEKAAIDGTAVAARLFRKRGDLIAIALQRTVAARRPHRGDGRELAVAAVKLDRRTNVEIAKTVTIGEAERVFAGDVRGHALEAAAGQRVLAGVHERDAPRLDLALVHHHGVVGHVEGHVRHVQEIIGEIFLDDVALVAAADHELIHAVARIDLHDVPQDRLAADLDHRLWPQIALFGNPRAKAAGQNDGFHGLIRRLVARPAYPHGAPAV